MQQRQRLKNLERLNVIGKRIDYNRFEASSKGVLIATDVAARGLDIPAVDHVIHYQIPRTPEVTGSFVEFNMFPAVCS